MAKEIVINTKINTDSAVKSLTSLEGKMKNLTSLGDSLGKVAGGIGAAFSAANGVIGTFGDTLGYSAEEIENAQKKAASYLSIVQAIKPVMEGVQSAISVGIKIFSNLTTVVGYAQKAFAVLNAVLIANPIGLIVTAIGALVAAVIIFYEEIQQAIDWVRNLDTEFQILIGIIGGPLIGALLAVNWALEELGIIGKGTNEELMRGFNNVTKAMTTQQIEEKKLAQQKNENAKKVLENIGKERSELLERYDFEIKKINAAGKSSTEMRLKMLEDLKASLLKEKQALMERYKYETDLFEKTQLVLKFAKNSSEIKKTEEDLTLATIENNTEKIDAANKYGEERKRIAREIEDMEVSLIENEIQREEMRALLVYKRQIEDFKGTNQEKIRLTELYGEQLRQTLNAINGDIILDTEENAEEIADIMITGITPPESEFTKVEEEYKNFFQRVKAMAQENSEASAEFIKKETEAWTAAQMQKIDTFQMYSDAVTSIGSSILDISDNFRKKDEKEDLKSKKRRFEFDKIANITTAGIEGAKGIVKAVAASPTTFGLPFSAFVGATTLAQITAIASKRFDGGTSGANSISSISTPQPQLPVEQSLFATGQGGLQTINPNQSVPPVRAYVVNQEIQNENQLINTIQQRSTL